MSFQRYYNYFSQPPYKYLLIVSCIQTLAPDTISFKGSAVQTLTNGKQTQTKNTVISATVLTLLNSTKCGCIEEFSREY